MRKRFSKRNEGRQDQRDGSASALTSATLPYLTPPELNNLISLQPFISDTESNCSVVFHSLNLMLSWNLECSSGFDQGFADSSFIIVSRASGSGFDDAGPGLIQTHSCGRHSNSTPFVELSSALVANEEEDDAGAVVAASRDPIGFSSPSRCV